ncbi:MAG TPA: TonB-dependent receptor, partial [Flavobacterium sp.]
MKLIISCLVLNFFVQSHAQTKHEFKYSSARLNQVLDDIESKFNIKYSYADSIVSPKLFSLEKNTYSLDQLNAEIQLQTALSVVKIDNRYYSIRQNETETAELLEEVLIFGFLSKGITKTTEKVIIDPRKVEELPGVTDADILFSLQQLPGVKSPNETASGLHIRGGTPDQNLVLWDGIRLYHPGHLFGMISAFNPNIEQTVNYYNKAVSPKFGERISSVIDIKSTDKIKDSLLVNAGVNALNADLYVRFPLVKKKLGVQLAGRKSFTEWMQTPTFNSLAEKVFQNTTFRNFDEANKFQFQDYSAKLNYSPNRNTKLSVTGVLIDNYLNYSGDDIAGSRNQKMDIGNYGYSLAWEQKYNEKLSHNVLFYYSAYTFNYQRNLQLSDTTFDRFTKLN